MNSQQSLAGKPTEECRTPLARFPPAAKIQSFEPPLIVDKIRKRLVIVKNHDLMKILKKCLPVIPGKAGIQCVLAA